LTHVICDLDGVLYRGCKLIPGSAEALQRLVDALPVLFVTNNSTRPPAATAEKITQLTGVNIDAEQVLTSSMAAATMLEEGDSPVLVVGEQGVADAITTRGLEVTPAHDEARAVVVGLTRRIDYEMIAAAADAVREGARFIATNIDPTFPTESGLLPGAGSLVAAIAAASGREPEVAGKPHAPMRRLIEKAGVSDAWVIGDRLDTDIALASDHPDWRTIVVLTGVTGEEEAQGADVDFVVADFSRAVDVVLTALEGR